MEVGESDYKVHSYT